MSEKPEPLFPGVEWNGTAGFWHCMFGVLERATAGPYANRWQVRPEMIMDPRNPLFDSLPEAVTWLREKVIEARDELCRRTGTKAVSDE